MILIALLRIQRKPPEGEGVLPTGVEKQQNELRTESPPIVKIAPEKVPEHLRDLIPMAEKWGIGDDDVRLDFADKATEAEKNAFRDALRGRTAQVTEWLDSFEEPLGMTEEAGYFMYMLLALDESGLWPD